MYRSFLIKYAEIGVKGKNRYLFEDRLCDRIRYALTRFAANALYRYADHMRRTFPSHRTVEPDALNGTHAFHKALLYAVQIIDLGLIVPDRAGRRADQTHESQYAVSRRCRSGIWEVQDLPETDAY